MNALFLYGIYFRAIIFIILVNGAYVEENRKMFIDIVRNKFCGEKEKEVETFTPDWRKTHKDDNETNIYFKNLKSAWESS